MDGIYQVSLSTPMGMEKGTMELHSEEQKLTGMFTIMGGRHPISGTVAEEGFSFSGVMNHMVGKVNYTVAGNVDGNAVRAIVRTNYGNFNMNGTKTI